MIDAEHAEKQSLQTVRRNSIGRCILEVLQKCGVVGIQQDGCFCQFRLAWTVLFRKGVRWVGQVGIVPCVVPGRDNGFAL